MKVAIMTLPLHINYGGILQAFALQTVLERKGHSVIILDRDYDYPNVRLLIFRVLSLIKTCYRIYVGKDERYVLMNPFSLNFKALKLIGYSTLPFVYRYINLSPKFRTSYTLLHYLKKTKIDCVIVGSDQIWRKQYAPSLNDAYLNGFKGKKIAYAVSFGTDVWEYNEKETQKCKFLANKFETITVREDTGCTLCKKYLNVKAEHVLDPTMLLNSSDYLDIIKASYTLPSEGNLLCYILDQTSEIQKMVDSIVEEYHFIPFSVNWKIRDSIYLEQPSVEQWLRGFADADFILTDSFHACVFAILFNKSFVVWGNKVRGLERMKSLLTMFGLEERLVTSFEEFLCRKSDLVKDINYKQVNILLEKYRKKSIEFLNL